MLYPLNIAFYILRIKWKAKKYNLPKILICSLTRQDFLGFMNFHDIILSCSLMYICCSSSYWNIEARTQRIYISASIAFLLGLLMDPAEAPPSISKPEACVFGDGWEKISSIIERFGAHRCIHVWVCMCPICVFWPLCQSICTSAAYAHEYPWWDVIRELGLNLRCGCQLGKKWGIYGSQILK